MVTLVLILAGAVVVMAGVVYREALRAAAYHVHTRIRPGHRTPG